MEALPAEREIAHSGSRLGSWIETAIDVVKQSSRTDLRYGEQAIPVSLLKQNFRKFFVSLSRKWL